jgi:thiaminase/transcriptional activator TenA
MGFSDHLKKIAQPIWDAQLTHPFVLGLGDGSLPEAKFRFYILQDALFLFDLAKLFALAATRATDLDTIAYLSKLQVDTIQVERALHQEYAKRWRMTETEMASVPMAPTNYAYTRHLRSIAQTGSLAEILVAALPCAWIYCEVGVHFTRQGPPPAGHPYQNWLALYGSPEFAEVARWMREAIDQLSGETGSAERARMEETFVISSRYEWSFWEMAWREERWPI